MALRAVTIAAVLGSGVALGDAPPFSALLASVPTAEGWVEVAWPFPYDAWGAGRAFRCPASACGSALAVYVRPKIGFCNCTTGVADDDEIDRVGDVALIGEDYRPAAAGSPASLGSMKGRARAFVVGEGRAARPALGLAVSSKCDAVVATVTSEGPLSPAAQAAALRFLDGALVAPWAEASVGLQ